MINKRILVMNMFATYGRTLLSIVVGLFSVRWVLAALGEVDFGLNNLVGAIVSFVAYFNTTISGSVSRYYAFSIGEELRGGERIGPKTVDWFNTAFLIHVVLAVFLDCVVLVVGEVAIRCWLTIPGSRLATCVWVLRFSAVSLFFSCVSAPYVAMFYAKQNIVEMSMYAMISTLCVGGIAYSLEFIHGDLLLCYSALMVSVHSMIMIVQMVRARFLFKSECRIQFPRLFSPSRTKDILGFIGWNMVTTVGELVRGQGSAFFVNVGWGPSVNAAYAVGNQVSAQTASLSAALQNVISPALTTEAGAGEKTLVSCLILRMEKICTLLVLVFSVPLCLEIDYVLELWLKKPPAFASVLCMAMLTMFVIEKIAAGHGMALGAYRKLVPYNLIAGGAAILVLPGIFVMDKFGLAPWSIGFVFILLALVKMVFRVLLVQSQVGFSSLPWVKSVFLPIIGCAIISTMIGMIIRLFFGPSFMRLAFTCLFTSITLMALSWLFVFTHDEKSSLRGFLLKHRGETE